MILSKGEMENVDFYECIVHDDSGRVGFNRFSTKPVVKKKINTSQRSSVSRGKSFGFLSYPESPFIRALKEWKGNSITRSHALD